MRCPACGIGEDKVVDSRAAEDGAAIRRRRECLVCGRRFTTYERVEESPLFVVKRNGTRQIFDRAKVVAGVQAATKNLAVSSEQVDSIGLEVEEAMRLDGPDVASETIGAAVLERLKAIDGVAYVRFASVHKVFTDPDQFTREVRLLSVDSDSHPTPEAGGR